MELSSDRDTVLTQANLTCQEWLALNRHYLSVLMDEQKVGRSHVAEQYRLAYRAALPVSHGQEVADLTMAPMPVASRHLPFREDAPVQLPKPLIEDPPDRSGETLFADHPASQHTMPFDQGAAIALMKLETYASRPSLNRSSRLRES